MAKLIKYNGEDVVAKYAENDTKARKISTTLDNLQDQIDNLKALGRFLSVWYADTHTTQTMPETLPYNYITGDYFIVGRIATGGATNYKPTGTVIPVGSTYPPYTTESSTIAVGDFYKFDGTSFIHIDGKDKSIGFANITGNPTDNQALANALSDKVSKTTDSTLSAKIKVSSSGGLYTDQITPTSVFTVDASNGIDVGNEDLGTAIKGSSVSIQSGTNENPSAVNLSGSVVRAIGTDGFDIRDSSNQANVITPNTSQASSLTFQLPASSGTFARAEDVPPITAETYTLGE